MGGTSDTADVSGVHSVHTASGRISCSEAGSGPVALFVHGVLMNKHLWRHQLSGLSGIRRCIAIDLLAHGDTEIDRDQDVSVIANAQMIVEVLDELHIDRVDIVGNDSGGAISQIFAALNPGRVRTLTLTDCDTSDNWPPAAFAELLEATARGELGETLHVMLADKAVYRSPDGLGMAYERPQSVSDDDIDIYLQPFVRSEQRLRDLERFLDAFDYEHTVKVEPALRQLQAPTLIVWGTDDIYFPMKWAYWLADTIPGAKPPVEIPGGRLFFPEERPEVFNEPLRAHLLAGCDPDSQSASSSEVPA
jgi:pimeloyl-ACP methyl ester carboxylesterase